MPTLIPIDRDTIRRNPHAGETMITVPGREWYTGTILVSDTGAVFRCTGSSLGEMYVEEVLGDPGDHFDWHAPIDFQKAPTSHVSWWGHRDTLVYGCLPQRPWLYDYLPTNVTCEKCNAVFDHTLLESDYMRSGDEDECWSEGICPRCGEWDCCEVEYEKPEDVLLQEQ